MSAGLREVQQLCEKMGVRTTPLWLVSPATARDGIFAYRTTCWHDGLRGLSLLIKLRLVGIE